MDLYYHFGSIRCGIINPKLFGSNLMHYHIVEIKTLIYHNWSVVDKDGNTICKTETEEMAQNLLNEDAK